MTLETLRQICRALPGVTEDIKWGSDLAFSVGAKMFCVANTEPPHQVSFKCTPEDFGELVERPGVKPAPYLARAMWVQEEELGETLGRGEFERLLRSSYDLVVATLPTRLKPGVSPSTGRSRSGAPRETTKASSPAAARPASRRSRSARAAAPRRRR
jgi:predicted DNA-binding protein (MmcQ/YjbR family)